MVGLKAIVFRGKRPPPAAREFFIVWSLPLSAGRYSIPIWAFCARSPAATVKANLLSSKKGFSLRFRIEQTAYSSFKPFRAAQHQRKTRALLSVYSPVCVGGYRLDRISQRGLSRNELIISERIQQACIASDPIVMFRNVSLCGVGGDFTPLVFRLLSPSLRKFYFI